MLLTETLASRFASIALGHVTREYPNKLDHVMACAGDVCSPRTLHSIFYGSFDWHSCVHSTWMLARLEREFPKMAQAEAIDGHFARSLTPENVAGEMAYLKRPESRGFERPYGWAWALMLAAELRNGRYGPIFRPLEEEFVARFTAFLPLQTYPIRTAAHTSTAFALCLAADYAKVAGDETFLALLRSRAREWFGADRDAPCWEPDGDAFLSPVLCEAEAMRRLLPSGEFAVWFAAFLPKLAQGKPETLFIPATVSDRSDGKTAHLDGLNLSRAWCMRGLASALQGEQTVLAAAAETHIAAALPHVAGDYMGEHWLASFATLALLAD
ncbi:MAG: DUF2891 domain-containing protein [Rhizomicrobium sp.]|nr:DUF2891 domain-containing protein [Rhizomicrobium sp.]